MYVLEIEKLDGTVITICTYPEMIKSILGYCEYKEIKIRKANTKEKETRENG